MLSRLLVFSCILLALGGEFQAQDSEFWWNERVFYEVFVRSFYDSDGDGIGDFRGLTQQLDYLNDGDSNTSDDLGITGIWLMPINEADSYHGYDVVDYYALESDYGTLDDFRMFLDAAHERGIAVIIDLVMNHTADEHPWFAEAINDPAASTNDYYIWSDNHPGYDGPWEQPVWYPLGDRYYYGLFAQGMPDLNFTNPAVTDEMYAIASFWLDEMGVDGFRLDAAKHLIEAGEQQENTPATLMWLANFKQFVKETWPDALIVGEVVNQSPIVAQYIPESLDIAFEFDLAGAMIDAVQRRDKDALAALQQQVLGLYPPGQYGAFLSNHDQVRIMSVFLGDEGAARVLATLLLTNPGVPFIYYGEEIGMQGNKPDERIRTPLQWTDDRFNAGFSTVNAQIPPDASVTRVNVELQDNDPESLLNHYRQLIRLRSTSAALQYGDFLAVESSARQVYSYLRYTEDEILLVLVNLHHRPITDYELSLDSGPLSTDVTLEMLMGEGQFDAPTLNADGGFESYVPVATLPPRSSYIVRFKKDA